MKNKNTMLILGIGVAYLLYQLYAKKMYIPGILLQDEKPLALYPTINPNEGGGPFRVDDVRTAEVPDTPSTYQSFYGKLNGSNIKVPTTC